MHTYLDTKKLLQEIRPYIESTKENAEYLWVKPKMTAMMLPQVEHTNTGTIIKKADKLEKVPEPIALYTLTLKLTSLNSFYSCTEKCFIIPKRINSFGKKEKLVLEVTSKEKQEAIPH